MKKKLLVVAILLSVFSFLLISSAFANTNMDTAVNGVRNFVGGAENVIEDAGQGVTNGVKNGMNTIDNGARNMTAGTSNGNDNYNASRTTTRATTDSNTTGMFNTTNIWTWVVLAIVGAVIVGLVMYYAKQNNVNVYNNNDE